MSDGWVSIDDIKPSEFYLVYLKNSKGNIFPGWWSGNGWDGFKKEHFGEIKYWKFLDKKDLYY